MVEYYFILGLITAITYYFAVTSKVVYILRRTSIIENGQEATIRGYVILLYAVVSAITATLLWPLYIVNLLIVSNDDSVEHILNTLLQRFNDR